MKDQSLAMRLTLDEPVDDSIRENIMYSGRGLHFVPIVSKRNKIFDFYYQKGDIFKTDIGERTGKEIVLACFLSKYAFKNLPDHIPRTHMLVQEGKELVQEPRKKRFAFTPPIQHTPLGGMQTTLEENMYLSMFHQFKLGGFQQVTINGKNYYYGEEYNPELWNVIKRIYADSLHYIQEQEIVGEFQLLSYNPQKQ